MKPLILTFKTFKYRWVLHYEDRYGKVYNIQFLSWKEAIDYLDRLYKYCLVKN